MKKRVIYFFICMVAGVVSVSCSEVKEKEESVEKIEEVVESIVQEEPVDKLPDYAADFERLKEAIITKDIKGVSAFASSDAIDAEIIVEAFSDPDFLEQLRGKSFNDVQKRMEGEIEILEFSVYVSSADEEGNEYESGLYLYFSKNETGLLLDNFFAAG